jgi:hypothetical protein
MFDGGKALTAALLAGSALLMGCEPAEGDYWVYRVAFQEASAEGGCWWPNDQPPPDEAASSNTFNASATLTMYVAFDDVLLLDVQVDNSFQITLPEDEDADNDGDFTFTGVTTDISYIGIDQSEAVISETTFNTLVLETHGSAVNGTLQSKTVIKCDFLTPVPMGDVCPAPPPPDCIRTSKFDGVELDDVTVYQDVNKNQPAPPPSP